MASRTRVVESTGNIDSREVITMAETETAKIKFFTNHENPTIKQFYISFKESTNPALWLEENRVNLEKFDIKVDNLKKLYADG